MSSPSVPSGSQDRKDTVVSGVVGSLIATALVATGVWLAGRQVPDEMALHFTSLESKVDKLSTWYIRIANNSDVAFDVKISPPSSSIIRFEYSPRTSDAKVWNGQITKGRVVEALYVSEDPNVRLSPAVVQSSIVATYQERNSLTGVIENRPGEVRDASAFAFVRIVRTAQLVFWFLLPTLFASVLLIIPKGWKFIQKRFRS